MAKPKLPVKKFYQKRVIEDTPDKENGLSESPTYFRYFFIAVIVAVISACAGLPLRKSWGEIMFAIQHPEIVREVKNLYQISHDEADKEILLRQRMALPTEEVKKE